MNYYWVILCETPLNRILIGAVVAADTASALAIAKATYPAYAQYLTAEQCGVVPQQQQQLLLFP